MKRPTGNRAYPVTDNALPALRLGHSAKSLAMVMFAGMLVLSACGGGSSSSSQNAAASPLSGNWQFTLTAPQDNSFVGGVQGGFLLQNNGNVNGAVVYSVALPQPPPAPPVVCNSGSAPIIGTISGGSVTFTTTAGAQTFTLTGTLSGDGKTMSGSYTTTDGKGCGTLQVDGMKWTATLVPSLTGSVQGSIHSVTSAVHLNDQDFPVTGTLTQGENLGASNATVTGTLAFENYPCLDFASVSGTISGSSVILEIFASNGLNVGRVGAPVGFQNPSPVAFESSSQGNLLHGVNGYGVSTKACPGGNLPGDIGNICLAVGNTKACAQPVLLTPASIAFPVQALGTFPTGQTITLTNNDPSGAPLDDLSLTFTPQAGNPSPFPGQSDFNGLPNFTETDTCADPPGSSFSLAPQQSCTITISFAPQQGCPWLPSTQLGGVAPPLCSLFPYFPLGAKLTVNSPKSADGDNAFAVPITGVGLSALVPSTPELDFGSEAVGQTSPAQSLSFTNQGLVPVQILPATGAPCGAPGQIVTLPRPLAPGKVSGFQVLTGQIIPDGSTIDYLCDSDLVSTLPNFQIPAATDNCSGRVLAPQEACSLQVVLAPQPSTSFNPPPDYFLELDTLQCTSDVTTNCEIDSGRFPVELKANFPSPLRMSPSAGLDFGSHLVGFLTDPPLTIKLFNDPSDPNARTVSFTGNLVKGDYLEVDDCGSSLAPGGSCTLTIRFKPQIVGFDPGTLTIGYIPGQIQTVYLRGLGCTDCELPPPPLNKK